MELSRTFANIRSKKFRWKWHAEVQGVATAGDGERGNHFLIHLYLWTSPGLPACGFDVVRGTWYVVVVVVFVVVVCRRRRRHIFVNRPNIVRVVVVNLSSSLTSLLSP